MAFAIGQNCCNDTSCLSVCPVNCIHPTESEPEFGHTDQLYVDPRTCIDCGACADACPVDAVMPVTALPPAQASYAQVNAEWFSDRPAVVAWDPPRFPRAGTTGVGALRVAVVGTGPAASYAAQELLRAAPVSVTFFDRLDVAGGLVRFGVAPDHVGTRRIGAHFAHLYRHPRVTMRLGTELGRDVTPASLAAEFDAVVYAVGAGADRGLDVPGAELPGVRTAREFVGWYNDHPDAPDDLHLGDTRRVVVIGNGNVALDAARILLSEPAGLSGTEIAPRALEALRSGGPVEVVVVGRRGPEHARYTRGELEALRHLPGVELGLDGHGGAADAVRDAAPGSHAALLQGLPVLDEGDLARPPSGRRRLVLSFGRVPAAFLGSERVEAVRFTDELGGDGGDVPAELVLVATGLRGAPVEGLPFDPETATVPSDRGRVRDDDGTPRPGAYVVGWIKRGASGGIGTNRLDAVE
ncbi:FAD-dependent oxidoreductase, partial [Jatrophihabitans endophyticus]|uniref:FAD-dependent oxidoreductase n=1 Tax=Jatrophihabitans endophyticus TaxID=1206085 RepID=UPI001A0D1EA3